MPYLKPRAARPLKPNNTMHQAGATRVKVIMDERASTVKEDVMRVKVIMDERASTVKEDVMRLVEAQIAGGVDLSPEEMVDAAFLMVDKIDKMAHGKEGTTCSK